MPRKIIGKSSGRDRNLLYHLLVLMAELNISLDDVKIELEKRREKTNNLKPERRKIEEL